MKTIKSTHYTGVRNLVRSIRLYEKVREIEKILHPGDEVSKTPQLIVVYDNGEKSQVSGQNQIFHDFVNNGGYLGDFSGKGSAVRNVHDPDYNQSSIKVLRYDQCFKICGGDARKG